MFCISLNIFLKVLGKSKIKNSDLKYSGLLDVILRQLTIIFKESGVLSHL